MIKSVTIKGEVSPRLHFKKATLERVNILFGGNGVGKTTFLNYILDQTKRSLSLNEVIEGFSSSTPKTKIIDPNNTNISLSNDRTHIVCSFYNSKDNDRQNNPSPYGNSGTYALEIARRCHSNGISEGQSILYSLSGWLDDFLDNYKEDLEYVVLLDEIDSGLSCDHVNVVLHMLKDTLLNKPNIQVIASSNMYHWVYAVKRVLSMYTGKFITIGSYEEYFKIQMDNQPMVGKKSDFNFL